MATGRMKNGKSPGFDNIPAEMLKLRDEVELWLLKLFNVSWRREKVPECWGSAMICPIFKKGDRGERSNYSGISLLPHAFKIYERILGGRLRENVE